MSDRLAEIKERADFFGSHSGLVTISSRDALALVEIAKASREAIGYLDAKEEDAALVILDNDAREALSALDGEEGQA